MVTAKSVLKTDAKGALSISIITSRAAKYGLSFSSGLCKQFVGGAKNLADQFAPGIDFGIGKYLYEQGEKAASWGMNKLIAAQKWLKGKIR